jgi:hypothetical protein
MTFFDEVLTDRITVEAREVRFWRTVLTLLAGLLFGVGWVAYKTLHGVWFGLAWCGTAVRVGWQEAKAPTPRR